MTLINRVQMYSIAKTEDRKSKS